MIRRLIENNVVKDSFYNAKKITQIALLISGSLLWWTDNQVLKWISGKVDTLPLVHLLSRYLYDRNNGEIISYKMITTRRISIINKLQDLQQQPDYVIKGITKIWRTNGQGISTTPIMHHDRQIADNEVASTNCDNSD